MGNDTTGRTPSTTPTLPHIDPRRPVQHTRNQQPVPQGGAPNPNNRSYSEGRGKVGPGSKSQMSHRSPSPPYNTTGFESDTDRSRKTKHDTRITRNGFVKMRGDETGEL